ncbi:MAG: sugar phosphate isomerase/epimerase [Oscillospiraceae bacterium]|nr:sugar phosphate isomerase/epimerase [Oscillospiraceae bacterium]
MLKIDKSRVAGMNICYQLFPVEYFLDSMVEMGVQSIEFWGGYPHQFILDASYPPLKDIKKLIRERELNLLCYTPEQIIYPFNIADPDPTVRELSVEHFRRCVYATAELGAPKMLMTCGHGYENQPVEEAWKRSRESLRNIAEYAEKMGVTLALENLQRVETNLIWRLDQLKRMIDELQSPAVKAIVDTVPLHLEGKTTKDYIEAFGEDLIHVHIVDGKPTGHMAWGDGELDLDTDIQYLVDMDYKGTMSFEICGCDQHDPNPSMAKSFSRIEKYLK